MVTLVRAPNPSPMTLSGTNTYVIDCGDGQALVVDPGPHIERHVDAIVEAAQRQHLRIAAIALTHGHPDHAPAAAPLAARCGAPVYAHPKSTVRHDRELLLEGPLNVGSTALHTIDAPGHTFDHVVFYLPPERALFTGDVMQVTQDRKFVSFMYSYPNYIPVNAATARRIGEIMEPLAFDRIYGAFSQRVIASGAKAASRTSVERYLRAIA